MEEYLVRVWATASSKLYDKLRLKVHTNTSGVMCVICCHKSQGEPVKIVVSKLYVYMTQNMVCEYRFTKYKFRLLLHITWNVITA